MNSATTILAMALALAASAVPVEGQSRKTGKLAGGIERLLYVTDRSGISVYDINDSHKLLGKIDVPETGGYYGIAASPQVGQIYLSSNVKRDMVALDIATEKIVWRNNHAKFPDSFMVTPDGKTIYVPYRDEDFWLVLNASFGLDGSYAYPDGGAVIDTQTKKVVARIPTSEKLIEIDFRDGRPVKASTR